MLAFLLIFRLRRTTSAVRTKRIRHRGSLSKQSNAHLVRLGSQKSSKPSSVGIRQSTRMRRLSDRDALKATRSLAPSG
ncbi:hypothetical protein LXA43DRAFT_402008 [Ganoderma leucocontextum]|nr:hypothetical protein LXA43DRAFT_402008 [Ganoderma leucocontextum]